MGEGGFGSVWCARFLLSSPEDQSAAKRALHKAGLTTRDIGMRSIGSSDGHQTDSYPLVLKRQLYPVNWAAAASAAAVEHAVATALSHPTVRGIASPAEGGTTTRSGAGSGRTRSRFIAACLGVRHGPAEGEGGASARGAGSGSVGSEGARNCLDLLFERCSGGTVYDEALRAAESGNSRLPVVVALARWRALALAVAITHEAAGSAEGEQVFLRALRGAWPASSGGTKALSRLAREWP